MALFKNFIGGEWVEGEGVIRNINPSDTTDLVGEYAAAGAAQTKGARRRVPGMVDDHTAAAF